MFYLNLILLVLSLTKLSEHHCDGQALNKTKPLRLLILSPVFMIDQRQVQSGLVAFRYVFDRVNARSDLLSDYKLEYEHRDEFLGNQATLRLIEFRRDATPDVIQSPIIAGPAVSNGCKAIGRVLNYIHTVSVSSYCSASFLSDSTAYPNLFLSLTTGKTTSLAMIFFIRSIGKWNRVALVSVTINIADFTSALFFHDRAIANAIEVPFFNIMNEVNAEFVASLKASGLRIIVIEISSAVNTIRFLCEAYRQGMTGPRYVFLAKATTFSLNPQPGCTALMLAQQYRQTFYFGNAAKPADVNRVSDLGGTGAEFDAFISRATNYTMDDYLTSFLLHDMLTTIVLALNETDRRLKTDFGLSLGDYSSQSELVARVARQAVLATETVGIRVGRTSYNKNGQLLGDIHVISQWTPQNGLQNIALFQQSLNKSFGEFDMRGFSLRNISKFSWITGNPPLDQPMILRSFQNPSLTAVLVLWTLVAATSLFQVFGAAAVVLQKPVRVNFPKAKLVGLLFGCQCLSASAAVFAANRTLESSPHIIASYFLLGVGISVAVGMISARLIMLGAYVKEMSRSHCRRMQGSIAQSHLSSFAPLPPVQRQVVQFTVSDWRKIDLQSVGGAFTLSAVALSILIAWAATQDVRCLNKELFSPVYDETADVIAETWYVECSMSSEYEQTGWALLGTITALNILALLVAFVRALQLRHIKVPSEHGREILASCLSAIVAGTLLPAGILIALILGRNPINQQVAIAFSIITLSGLISVPLIYPSWK